MHAARLEAEEIAFEVKGPDLPASIREQLVGAHRPLDHQIDEFGVFALAVDLLIPSVAHAGTDELGAISEQQGISRSSHGPDRLCIVPDGCRALDEHGNLSIAM
jgi:hypothetical protein